VNKSRRASWKDGVGGALAELCKIHHDSGSDARHSASEQGRERRGSAFVIFVGMSNVIQSWEKKQ